MQKGKRQTSEHTINWSRNLPSRLRWSTPAGKVLVGTVLLKTFWFEARRPVALDWYTLWPANSKCKKTTSGFYRPLEWDFSTMELSWITSKGTIARDCAQIFLSFPFYLTSTFSSKSLFCMLPTGSNSQLESGKQCCCNLVLMMRCHMSIHTPTCLEFPTEISRRKNAEEKQWEAMAAQYLNTK